MIAKLAMPNKLLKAAQAELAPLKEKMTFAGSEKTELNEINVEAHEEA